LAIWPPVAAASTVLPVLAGAEERSFVVDVLGADAQTAMLIGA
jgi:hypothetical protein